jgi:hypothetical protein
MRIIQERYEHLTHINICETCITFYNGAPFPVSPYIRYVHRTTRNKNPVMAVCYISVLCTRVPLRIRLLLRGVSVNASFPGGVIYIL